MKKIVIRCRPHKEIYGPYNAVLEMLESFEMLDLLKVDFDKGEKVGLIELELKEGIALEDLPFPEGYEILSIVRQEGNKYVLIGKVKSPGDMIPIYKMFDLDIVWAPPIRKSKNEVVMGAIGDEENLRKLLQAMGRIGDVIDVSVVSPSIEPYDMLSGLTRKQKEVIIAAKEAGYYDYPRRINAEELSRKIGISKATTLEHLRKAEGRLLSTILASY